MIFKSIAGIFAAVLLVVYIWPVVFRLKETALWVIVLIGIAMMLIDLWQSLRSKND